MKYSIAILPLLLAAILPACGAEMPPALPEGQIELATAMQQAGLTPERCYLKAAFIHGGEARVAAYPREGFGYDWNFTNGTLCGIIEHSSGLEAFTNRDGALSFTVRGKDSFFGWGDVNLGEKPIKLGHDSLNVAKRGLRLYGFRMRIRQSLPESVWSIALRRNHSLNGFASDVEFLKPVSIKGQDWQTVVLEIPPSRRKGFLFYSGVRLVAHTPGNQVQIAWIEPCVKEYHPFFRRDFELPSRVRWARCSIQAGLNFTVYVNGRQAAESRGNHPYMQNGLWNYNLPPELFQKGRNAIVVETTSGAIGGGVNRLLFDAALLCENGEYFRLDSGDSWKVADQVEPGQFLPDAGTGVWGKVGVTSNTAADTLSRIYWFNPSWKGLLDIQPADGRGQPIYTAGENISLRIAAPVRAGKTAAVAYALYDEMGDNYIAADTLIQKDTLPLKTDGADHVALFEARAGELPANKAYALEVELAENGVLFEKYRYEFAVCGPVSQPVVLHPGDYTNGMELKLVCEIDPTAALAPGEFVACAPDREQGKHGVKEAPSSVITTPLGKFRQPPEIGGYVSWKFRINNPARPHVVLADYPDDTTRCQTMWITAAPTVLGGGYYPDNQSANDTVMLGGENPLTHTIRQHHAVFFPMGRLYTVSFGTIAGQAPWSPERSARIGKIRVYEILNDVPMVKINDAPGPRRWLGQRLEPGPRAVMQSCLSSPLASRFRRAFILSETPNFYRTWLITSMNLVKRMRFAGENCIGYGVYMYQGVLYPSDTFRVSALETFGSFKDSMTLTAKLFAENDLGIFAGTEIIGFPQQTIRHTDIEVAQGADTPAQVDKSGRQQLALFGTLNPNWLHPETEKYLDTLMDELLQLYGKLPAFQGVVIHTVLGSAWGINWAADEKEPYLTGYGDWTIGLFEKETGLKIPVEKDDPRRFAGRYDWLMANAKPQWAQWRKDKMTGVYRKIARRLRAVRADLKVVSHFFGRDYVHGPYRADYKPVEALDAYTPYGIDVQALQADENVIFIKDVFCDGPAAYYLEGKGHDRRARAHHDSYTAAFANDGRSGAAIRYSWYEYQLYSPKDWPKVYSGLESWPTPGSDFFADYYANVFIRMNPALMFFSIVDCAMWNGREPEQARFAQAYRSLPNGIYQPRHGNGLGRNIRVALCRYGEDIYGYAANPHYWELAVKLEFAPGARVTDLIAAAAVAGPAWDMTLAPYQIKTFKITGSRDLGAVKGAQTAVSPAGQKYFAAQFDTFTNRVARDREGLQRRGKLQDAEDLIKSCAARIEAGEWADAAEALGTTLLWNDLLETAWAPEHAVKSAVIPETSAPVNLAQDPLQWGHPPIFELRGEGDIRFAKQPWQLSGAQDLALSVFMRWDTNALYLGFRVRDDVLLPRANAGDSIEVYLDADLAGDYGRNVYDADDFNIKLVPPADATGQAEVLLHQGTETGVKSPADAAGIQVDGRRLDDGYFVAAAIPWTKLKLQARAGLEIGLDVMVIDMDGQTGFKTMLWSAPGAAVFSNPRVMGKAVLGAKHANAGDSTGAELQVKELYAAGQYPDAYALAITNKLSGALVFLYGADQKSNPERFLELTGQTGWESVLLYRNLIYAGMNPIPPRGIEDARKLVLAPDLRDTGQPGPACYGYLTLIRDAQNRGALEQLPGLLTQALLAGQLSSTMTPQACELARIYQQQGDDRRALAFWALAWCMERDRQPVRALSGEIAANIANTLDRMGLDEKARVWQKWAGQPLAGGDFPLYGAYSFPPEWIRAVTAKFTDFDRSAPLKNFMYAQMLFRVGRVREAIAIRDQALNLLTAASMRAWVERDTRHYESWLQAFPRGIIE